MHFLIPGVDFFRSIPSSPNGSRANLSSGTKTQLSRKRSDQEFQSVTGGLLEEVVGMINSSGTADK